MTNDKREALIEKAAKAILDAAETPENVRDEQVWEWARRDARAALAVFEQAHTPTDEWEARKVAEERYPTLRPHPGEAMYPKSALHHYKQGAFIAGWKARRPVQGEPTDAELAELAASLDVYEEVGSGTPLDIFISGYRAALRAVFQTGENR